MFYDCFSDHSVIIVTYEAYLCKNINIHHFIQDVTALDWDGFQLIPYVEEINLLKLPHGKQWISSVFKLPADWEAYKHISVRQKTGMLSSAIIEIVFLKIFATLNSLNRMKSIFKSQ